MSISELEKKSFIEIINHHGFAVFDHHPISSSLVEDVYASWQLFFDSDEKFDYLYNGKSLDGYFPFGFEKGKNPYSRDLKEFYYFYPWGKCPQNLRKNTLLLHQSLLDLGKKLISWLGDALPSNISNLLSMPLSEMIKDSPRPVLRIIHYPPLDETHQDLLAVANKGAIRAAEHEDLTLLTLLPIAKGVGLEVKDKEGKWHNIKNLNNILIANMGEMLEVCTRKYYQASTHRVTNPETNEKNKSRYAIAFFLNPKDEVLLDETRTAGSFLRKHAERKLIQIERSSFIENATKQAAKNNRGSMIKEV